MAAVVETPPTIPPGHVDQPGDGQSPASSGGVGVAELAAEHARQFPTPDQAAADAEAKKLLETLDPELYVIRDGRPLFNADGSPKKKTGPKPKKPEATGPDEFAALGTVYADLFFGGCITFLGKEWKPDEEQRERVTHALGVYLRVKGMKDLPPEWMLASALLGYVADKPQVQALRAKATALVMRQLNRGKHHEEKSEAPALAAGGG